MRQRGMAVEWGAFAAGLAGVFILWFIVHTSSYGGGVPNSAELSQRDNLPNGQGTLPAIQGQTLNARPLANYANGGAPRTAREAAAEPDAGAAGQPRLSVRVYLAERRVIEQVPLELYVRGVVAAEMPAAFEPAALEAQALAARTYIVRRLLQRDTSHVPVPGADVTDTQTHQVYRSLAEMNRLRTDKPDAWHKADEAARRTQDQIIAYDNKPIEALYFSSSNGYTENSEEVFPFRLPYLRSVASPWDRTSDTPHAGETTTMPLAEFYDNLGVRFVPAVARIVGNPPIKVTEWTEGHRIKTLTIGDKSFTGPQVRSQLNLRSASFTWTVNDGNIAITSYGNGHGVGMSQWGAERLAEAGRTAEQIIRHYYTGAQIMEVSKLAVAIQHP